MRDRPYPRIGIFDGGAIYHDTPWEGVIREFERIDVFKILTKRFTWARKLNLSSYNIVFIGWAPDQVFLKENENEITRFLEKGGVLVCMGEFDQNWLPSTQYQHGFFNEIRITGATDTIFKGLSEADISDWGDSAHGYFRTIPRDAECFAKIFIRGREQCIGYIDTKTYAGSLLAMTIDPDFHTYNQIDTAGRMLQNVVDWAINEYEHLAFLPFHQPGQMRSISDFVTRYSVEIAAALFASIIASVATYIVLSLVA